MYRDVREERRGEEIEMMQARKREREKEREKNKTAPISKQTQSGHRHRPHEMSPILQVHCIWGRFKQGRIID